MASPFMYLPYTKKVLDNDMDSHKDVVTHLEPDVLECEVKWALGSITMNKASGGDGIPVKLFQRNMYIIICETDRQSRFEA